eukprot:scaffold1390_cov138-Cylindrotheca_fusiformis.AAC.64
MSNSQASTPSRQHKAPQGNAHMNVLGMDGTDLELLSSRSNSDKNAGDTVATKPSEGSVTTHVDSLAQGDTSSANENSPVQQQQVDLPGARTSWWGRVWAGHYDQVASQSTAAPPAAAPRYRPDSLMAGGSIESSGLDFPTMGGQYPTVEDQLRQDCEFFYQGFDDEPSPERRRRLRPFLSRKTRDVRNSTRGGTRFHTKYQQLNQDNNEMYGRHHDLALEEEGSDVQPVRFRSDSSINVLDTQYSSLFYEQDGRTLMKLPRDQMRLVMDQDLEPGIISVEQWRHAEESHPGAAQEMPQIERNPPLKYVLTVPDDLYRRVVSEMSYRLMPPCWGFFKCCHYHDDTERADIRLALWGWLLENANIVFSCGGAVCFDNQKMNGTNLNTTGNLGQYRQLQSRAHLKVDVDEIPNIRQRCWSSLSF